MTRAGALLCWGQACVPSAWPYALSVSLVPILDWPFGGSGFVAPGIHTAKTLSPLTEVCHVLT